MLRDFVVVLHLLSAIGLVGIGLTLGLLPTALRTALEPERRPEVWAAILAGVRPAAMFALGLLFVTGVLNIAQLGYRPGWMLLLKILLAVGVAGHVIGQVRGAGQRLIDAAKQPAESTPDVVRTSERSLQRLAVSQAALVTIILYISINLGVR